MNQPFNTTAPTPPAALPLDLARACSAAEQAAREAGAFTQQARGSSFEVELKQAGDPVSVIDRQAQALIRDALEGALPGIAFTGEESDGSAGSPAEAEWIVDPIDGTANYLRGYPQYAVSIALALRGEPVVGVVFDPARSELFSAVRGRGAHLNGMPLRCAEEREPLNALAATVFPKPRSPRMDAYLQEFGRMLRGFGGVRRSGAMTLELAALAAGRIDAFWAHDMGPWDVAAGMVLLREAGAVIGARDGQPVLASRSLWAATPAMAHALQATLGDLAAQ